MYVGVSDKARKITIGFGKMEAIGGLCEEQFQWSDGLGRSENGEGWGWEWEVRKLVVACVDNFWAKLDRERGADK